MSDNFTPVSGFTVELPGTNTINVSLPAPATTNAVAAPSSVPEHTNPGVYPDPNVFSITENNQNSVNEPVRSSIPLETNPYLNNGPSYYTNEEKNYDDPARMEGTGSSYYKSENSNDFYDDMFPNLPVAFATAVKYLLFSLNVIMCIMFLCCCIYYGSSNTFKGSYSQFFLYFFSFLWYGFYSVFPFEIKPIQKFFLKHIPILTSRWFMAFSPFIFLFTIQYQFDSYGGMMGAIVAANAFRIIGWFIQITVIVIGFVFKCR